MGQHKNQQIGKTGGNSKQRRAKERAFRQEQGANEYAKQDAANNQIKNLSAPSPDLNTEKPQKANTKPQFQLARRLQGLQPIWRNLKHNTSSYSEWILRKTWQTITAIGVLAGLFAFFYPRIDVSASVELDSQDPLKTVFTIKNSGYMPLSNVKYSCALTRILTKQNITVLYARAWRSKKSTAEALYPIA
jgi:hypothetical protein